MTGHHSHEPTRAPRADVFSPLRTLDHALGHVVREFHQRVKENCWDSLAGELIQHHAPHLARWGPPVCHGCDRRTRRTRRPDWPCSTYTTLAATVLNLPSRADVIAALSDMLTALSERSTRKQAG